MECLHTGGVAFILVNARIKARAMGPASNGKDPKHDDDQGGNGGCGFSGISFQDAGHIIRHSGASVPHGHEAG